MLDTVKLRLKDYEVRGSNNLRISTIFNTSGEEQGSCKLFDMSDGTEISGSKAYLNTDHFQLDILGRGSFVKFSVPKVYYGDNYKSVNGDQTKEVINLIQSELKDNGIGTNLFNSDLSRIDMFKQITPEEPFYNYAPIFRAVNGTSKKLRDYGTTFLWYNGSEQIAVYDKLQEMLINKKDIGGLPDTIRFENRLMNKRKIMHDLEFSHTQDLISYYNELEGVYKANLSKSLFMLNDAEFNEVLLSDMEMRLSYFMDYGGRYWLRKFLMSFGVDMVERYGIDNFISIVRRKYVKAEKQRAYRLKKNVKEMIAVNTVLRKGTPSKTLLTLYNELKHKLVA